MTTKWLLPCLLALAPACITTAPPHPGLENSTRETFSACQLMNRLWAMVNKTGKLSESWINNPGPGILKLELERIVNRDYPELRDQLHPISGSFHYSDFAALDALQRRTDEYMGHVAELMEILKRPDDYNDPQKNFTVRVVLFSEQGKVSSFLAAQRRAFALRCAILAEKLKQLERQQLERI